MSDTEWFDWTLCLIVQDEIDSVIVIGGGTRVPKVQEALLEAVGK